jgi:hypothetical protein
MTFEEWLVQQEYAENSIASLLARIAGIRRAYPDLDEQFEQDAFASLQREFVYTKHDEREGRPNPTHLPIVGNIYHNLATYRATLGMYVRYKQGTEFNPDPESEPEPGPPDAWPWFERHMQRALRQNIEQLEPKMWADDDGVERRVESGFIDITARDVNDRLVVVELKTGVAGQRAVAQILSYMGDIASEEDTTEVRGMLVAFDFDHKARAAAKMVPALELVKYGFRFAFERA